MKEEYFDSMPWTRVFVSGPLDPKWNPNKIHCQICNCNVSIEAKGPKEILRHYATRGIFERSTLEIRVPAYRGPHHQETAPSGERERWENLFALPIATGTAPVYQRRTGRHRGEASIL